MAVTLTFTDIEDDKVEMDVDFDTDGTADASAGISPAVCLALGAQVLFRMNSLWPMGLIAANAIANDVDMVEFTQRVTAVRQSGATLDDAIAAVLAEMQDDRTGAADT